MAAASGGAKGAAPPGEVSCKWCGAQTTCWSGNPPSVIPAPWPSPCSPTRHSVVYPENCILERRNSPESDSHRALA